MVEWGGEVVSGGYWGGNAERECVRVEEVRVVVSRY